MATDTRSRKKAKAKLHVPHGKAYILATFNNTIITITDMQGNAISWFTAGAGGFRGSRKATPFAAQVAVERAVKQAKEVYGLTSVEIYVQGLGPGRDSAMRMFHSCGMQVAKVWDRTPMPHNGCRRPKRRRV